MTYYTKEINDEIAGLLKAGKVGLLPTDTIYGLSASALDEKAVEKLHSLKDRDESKPFIVLISNIKQLEQLGVNVNDAKLVNKHWPGPLSVIFSSEFIPRWLQKGTKSLAVRMPDNKALSDLIEKTGPIISTSANMSGEPPAQSVEEAEAYFGQQLDFYVDKGKLVGQPSTLIKIENEKIEVIRQGAYKLS